MLFFSSGSTSKPKGILSAHRGVSIQMWRFRRLYQLGPEDHVRGWTANGFFWSGNFAMALGRRSLRAARWSCSRPSTPTRRCADAGGARHFPFAWPHQWAQLEAAPNWLDVDLSSMRYVDFKTPVARHPTVSTNWSSRPGLWQHRNLHDHLALPGQHAARVHAESTACRCPATPSRSSIR